MSKPLVQPEEVRWQNLLVRQVVTEKTKAFQMSDNQWVFEVTKDATKTAIKHAVEKLYKVTVTRVATLIVRGKGVAGRSRSPKGMRFFESHRPNWKKALVTLKEGQRLPLA